MRFVRPNILGLDVTENVVMGVAPLPTRTFRRSQLFFIGQSRSKERRYFTTLRALMRILKIVGLVLAVAFIVIQFVRPERNVSTQVLANGIGQLFAVPESVQTILQRSCYDCHSNNTVYPWYSNVEPVGWWLNSHIQNGKRHVNYDEYGTYRPLRQFVRFRDLIEQIKKDEMPLPSYLLIHRYAMLSAAEKDLLIRWSLAMMDTMKANYPADSLIRRPRNEVRSSEQVERSQKDAHRP